MHRLVRCRAAQAWPTSFCPSQKGLEKDKANRTVGWWNALLLCLHSNQSLQKTDTSQRCWCAYGSRSCWLSAVKLVQTSSRAPCGCRSPDMSSRICFMSAHILSNVEAEMRWHLRSTCQVMGVYAEHTSLLRLVPVVEPVYTAMSTTYPLSASKSMP